MNTHSDIVLTLIEPKDVLTIQNWKTYPDEFSELDYALREGGWLNEYCHKQTAKVFSAKYENELIGFSILSDDEEGTEFRIALNPDKIGKGFGRAISLATMKEAFETMGKESIYLIVRLNNFPAIKLYEQIGFMPKYELNKDIQGKPIRFLKMEYKK
jgi:RimJ/RimL family protein N-acetyltransferase